MEPQTTFEGFPSGNLAIRRWFLRNTVLEISPLEATKIILKISYPPKQLTRAAQEFYLNETLPRWMSRNPRNFQEMLTEFPRISDGIPNTCRRNCQEFQTEFLTEFPILKNYGCRKVVWYELAPGGNLKIFDRFFMNIGWRLLDKRSKVKKLKDRRS